MTLANTIESLQLMFPKATESVLIKELDVAQRKFVGRTRLLTAVGELSNIDSYISFTLPSTFKSLMGIYYYDADDNPIYDADLTIKAEVHTVGAAKKLTFRSTTFTPITALPTTIDSIQIEYYKYPEALVTRNSTIELPEQYWEALEMMVMIKLLKMYPRRVESNGKIYDAVDIQTISRLQYDVARYERDARIDRNVGDDDRGYDIFFRDQAGGMYLSGDMYPTMRSKVTSDIIQIEGGDVAYTKYYRVLVSDSLDYASGTKYYEVQSTSGFGTINVAVTPATPVITITSPSNEFTDDPATWVKSNQDTPYTYDNAGQITFTPYSTSFGVLEIEIFIY